MEVTFLAPSTKRTIGGVLSLYEFANGLARRGHGVNLVHLPVIDGHIETVTDLAWFPFDDRVRHHLARSFDAGAVPRADFVETTALEFFTAPEVAARASAALPPSAGLPFVFVQAYGIFTPEVDERAFRSAAPKVCIARWLADVVLERGVPPEDVEYIPYGLDHDTFRLTREIAGRPPQVAMLYNAHPLKGARYGLAALQEVRRRIGDVRVVLFGNKEPPDSLPEGFRYITLPPRDVLVNDIYNGSRVFLCSSVQEGFGFCSIEAMAGGCAVVTTDNGGSDDYATDEDNALVCEPGDVDGMADRVERLLSDDDTCTRIATRGCESVRRFDWHESARRLEDFLTRYAERSAPPRRVVGGG